MIISIKFCKSKKNNYYEKMYKKYIESSLNNPFSYFTLYVDRIIRIY